MDNLVLGTGSMKCYILIGLEGGGLRVRLLKFSIFGHQFTTGYRPVNLSVIQVHPFNFLHPDGCKFIP